MQIPVVDIFAGPGGLGEGFSAYTPEGGAEAVFRIAISAEMEAYAARTLRLRAFFRQFCLDEVPVSYYEYLAGKRDSPYTNETHRQWDIAGSEARQLELGKGRHDGELHEHIRKTVTGDRPWVLIGGPPCQAYSLVGRARNRAVGGYKPESDDRHFLYKHYLTIIQKFRPTVFVMENVKGILSSRVGGKLIFPQILDDLQHAGGRHAPRYRIFPLDPVKARLYEDSGDPHSFLLHSEELGVPQARHRVILVGVSEEIGSQPTRGLLPNESRFSVKDMIGTLPALRSSLTDRHVDQWSVMARQLLARTAKHVKRFAPDVSLRLESYASEAEGRTDPGSGGRWMPLAAEPCDVPVHLRDWMLDSRLGGISNHESRGHMHSDLMRYAYAAAFAEVRGRSPRGAVEFPQALHPNHKNWNTGKFVDRFKVQLRDEPSSTITSHLSRDGHYFIHPDPSQLRSLSVREAARLQTFPDNYFFEGPRGAQFRQIGNAVPPWLAHQIAEVVFAAIQGSVRHITPVSKALRESRLSDAVTG